MLDTDQLIRVGGSLYYADLHYDQLHSIIFPNKYRLTELILIDAHVYTMHGNATLMIAYIRTQFWIPNARNVIRFHVHKGENRLPRQRHRIASHRIAFDIKSNACIHMGTYTSNAFRRNAMQKSPNF